MSGEHRIREIGVHSHGRSRGDTLSDGQSLGDIEACPVADLVCTGPREHRLSRQHRPGRLGDGDEGKHVLHDRVICILICGIAKNGNALVRQRLADRSESVVDIINTTSQDISEAAIEIYIVVLAGKDQPSRGRRRGGGGD